MSSEPAARILRVPSPDFDQLCIPRTLLPAREWFRVHPSRFPAICFSINPNHRFSHGQSAYSILYVASDGGTCLFERFGDQAYDEQLIISRSLWNAHSLSVVQIPELHVCDLTDARTLSALRVDLGALMHHQLAVPQQWGLALQSHPAAFEGILFRSRFNASVCLALFNRRPELPLRVSRTDSLTDSDAAADWLDRQRVSLY